MSFLVSIDPGDRGGDTGIVILEYQFNQAAELYVDFTVPGGTENFSYWLEENAASTVEWAHIATVIVEDFEPRLGTPVKSYEPAQIVGICRYLWNATPVTPSGRKTAVPDKVLDRLGLYDFPGDHHGDRREAARHAVRWLKDNNHAPTMQKGWPDE